MNFKNADPRVVQIAILTGLTVYLGFFDDFFSFFPGPVVYILAGLIWQLLFSLHYRVPFQYQSVLISCLSLGILLKTNEIYLPVLVSFLVVSSKFWIRFKGSHIFNPSNLAIVLGLILWPDAFWLSPAQWGREVLFAFILSLMGVMLLFKVSMLKSTLTFLISYICCYVLYGLYMGDPLAVNMLVLEGGGLYLFAFFMLSDPRTSPRHQNGKYIYAAATAVIAASIELFAFWPTAVFHALCIVCLFVPLINRIFAAPEFLWDNDALRYPVPASNS